MAGGLRWCDFDAEDEPAVTLVHKDCGGEVGSGPTCPQCGGALNPRRIRLVFSDAFVAEREARRGPTAAAQAET